MPFNIQGNQDQAVEKLQEIESNSNPATRSLVPGKEIKDGSGAKPSLVCIFTPALCIVHSHMHAQLRHQVESTIRKAPSEL